MPHRLLAVLAACAALAAPPSATAQATADSPAITTPDKVETRIGTLDFKDGMPSKATAREGLRQPRLHARLRGVREHDAGRERGRRSARAFSSIGVKDNEVLVFSELMDAKSLFLTANADTVYFVGVLDLTKGPMVLETPPKALGTIDDCGGAGSSTSARPAPTAAKAAST